MRNFIKCGIIGKLGALAGANYFGDGSDGTLSTVGNVNLTSTLDGDIVVKNYTNLTVNSGHTLTTSNRCRGLVLFVDGNLTVDGTISMTARGCHANPEAGHFVPIATGTAIGDMTGDGGLAAAFDGDWNEIHTSCASKSTTTTAYIGKDWGASNDKLIKGVTVYSSSDYGYNSTGDANITITLEGSSTGAWGGEEVELGTTGTFADETGPMIKNIYYSGTTSYRYHRILLTSAASGNLRVSELQFWEASSDNNAVGTNGIRFPFLTSAGSDTLTTAEFEGCGSDLYNLRTNFPSIDGDGTIISFPRVGGSGGAGIVGSQGPGNNGSNGSTNQSGGGGSGGHMTTTGGSADGGKGTCFSGGVGSGGCGNVTATTVSDYGGAGGNGEGPTYNTGGGAGNPGGTKGLAGAPPYDGEDGTGGLLIIICSGTITVGATGTISSNGSDGGGGTEGDGAGSGGGSILLAYGTSYSNSGTVGCTGGLGATASSVGNNVQGGNGGNGTVQTLQIL